MDTLGYLAIDQYGQTYQIGNNHPRKWLMSHIGSSRADKMYCDTTGGAAKHIGYIVKGLWLRVFKVCDWKTENKKNSK
jgi:hypothetical protein